MKTNMFSVVIELSLILFALPAHAQTPIITTIAGSNIRTFYNGSNDTVAEFYHASALTLDKRGNLYICDGWDYAIRKVNLSTGIITLFAGNGDVGYSGDGGPAAAATLAVKGYFLSPSSGGVIHFEGGVAADGNGNVYIADLGNRVVRKVDTSGIIITFAGTGTTGTLGDNGPATSAMLGAPCAVATDLAGNVYISDEEYNVIRKVDTTGIITTVAGKDTLGYSGDGGFATAAELGQPVGICIDDSNNLYIADFHNNVVRKVSYTGVISTFAGNDTAGFSGDAGPASVAKLNAPVAVASDKKGNIYISDYNNCRVRMVNNSGLITTIAGDFRHEYAFSGDGSPATAAGICYPYGIAVDTFNNLYFCDFGNTRVREVDTSGIISTIAGNSCFGGENGPATEALLNMPFGVTTDGAGNIYFSEYFSNVVRKITSAGIVTTVAGNEIQGYSGDNVLAVNSSLYLPSAIALDKSGNLYIADYLNNRIRKVDNSTGIITTYAGTGRFGTGASDVAATATGLENPEFIALDSSDNLYISDGLIVVRVNTETGIASIFAGGGTTYGDGGPATNASLNPAGLAFDSMQNLYIADNGNNVIRKVNAQTGIITTVAGNYDSCTAGATFTNGGIATNQPLCSPFGLAINDSGNLFVTNPDQIFEVSMVSGSAFIISGMKNSWGKTGDGGPANSANLYAAEGIAIDYQGNLLVADFGNRAIRKINTGTYAGIQKLNNTQVALHLYPNPNTGTFTIEGAVPASENSTAITATVSNILGQEVFKTVAKAVNNYITIPVNLTTTLPIGIYYCTITSNTTNSVLEVMLAR